MVIVKETGRRLGMGINMYFLFVLFGINYQEGIMGIDDGEFIEYADGFVGVFSEYKYNIVKCF